MNELNSTVIEKFQFYDDNLKTLQNDFKSFKENLDKEKIDRIEQISSEQTKFDQAILDFDKEINSKTIEISDLVRNFINVY